MSVEKVTKNIIFFAINAPRSERVGYRVHHADIPRLKWPQDYQYALRSHQTLLLPLVATTWHNIKRRFEFAFEKEIFQVAKIKKKLFVRKKTEMKTLMPSNKN